MKYAIKLPAQKGKKFDCQLNKGNYLITAKCNHKPHKSSPVAFQFASWRQIGHLRCVDHRDCHGESHNNKEKLNQNDYQVDGHSEQCQLERANCFIDFQNTGESQDKEQSVDAVQVVYHLQ